MTGELQLRELASLEKFDPGKEKEKEEEKEEEKWNIYTTTRRVG